MLVAWRDEIAAVWPDLDEPERLERRLTDAQLLWVLAVHVVAAAPGAATGTSRSGRTPPGRRGSAPRWGTTGVSWCRRPPQAGLRGHRRPRRGGGRGAGRAVPGRPGRAAGLPGVPVRRADQLNDIRAGRSDAARPLSGGRSRSGGARVRLSGRTARAGPRSPQPAAGAVGTDPGTGRRARAGCSSRGRARRRPCGGGRRAGRSSSPCLPSVRRPFCRL